MSIPSKLRNAALAKKANIGRVYDSNGKHAAYYLIVTPEWKVYRHSVGGMLACLRQLNSNA
jgi:hypothetical protein